MANLHHSKPIPTLKNIHESDEDGLIEFLNTNSKVIGSIKHLGSFIDDIKITKDFGIKAKIKFLIVEREAFKNEAPRINYEFNPNVSKDIFEIDFRLPNSYPDSATEKEKFVVLSTIETHECNPKEKCSKCSGSGKCQSCDARGYNMCNSCKGTGKTDQRDGNYANGNPKYKKVGCYSCSGAGKKSCSSCNGSTRCSRCEGQGTITCRRCEGTSFYQTYLAYTNRFKTRASDYVFSEYKALESIILKTKNKIVYEDDLIEFQNKNIITYNKSDQARLANPFSQHLFNDMDNLVNLNGNEKIGRLHTVIETVPITSVEYTFEDKNYDLVILGDQNIVCFNEIPKKHGFKVGLFKRIMQLFTKKKRKIAFIYIASYMFNSDKSVDESEIKLLELFLNHIKLKPAEKTALLATIQQPLALSDIIPKIKSVQYDLRALIFAWQCVMQDGDINQYEIQAFNELAKLFKVDENGLEKIKKKAEKFAKLKDKAMLEEYFK